VWKGVSVIKKGGGLTYRERGGKLPWVEGWQICIRRKEGRARKGAVGLKKKKL